MFSPQLKENCTILATLKLSSAYAFNFSKAKILSSDKNWLIDP